MSEEFDRNFWDGHWQEAHRASGARTEVPANPYLARELGALVPGTALDAGCGEGAEAIWLARAGWQVTAADISTTVLARAAARATEDGVDELVQWLEADLGTWEPDTTYDLVTTHYAHPAIAQLDFYERLATWVGPGGTLLVVGHLQTSGAAGHGHDHGHPAGASVTAAGITARLDDATWEIVTAEEAARTLTAPGGRSASLQDVVVRATRRPIR